jgi:hypothetical protein
MSCRLCAAGGMDSSLMVEDKRSMP